MAGFDPDAYLASSGSADTTGFNPDAYLNGGNGQQQGGFWRNFALGAQEIPAGLMHFGYDVLNNLPFAEGSLDLATMSKEHPEGEGSSMVDKAGQAVTNTIGKATGIKTTNTKADTFTDKFGRVLGGTVPYALMPEAGADTLAAKIASMARNATVGTGLAAGQAGVEQHFPNNPAAQTIGGMIGAIATHKALATPGAIKRAVTPLPADQAAANYVLDQASSAGKTVGDIRDFDTQGKPFIGAEAIGTPGITATRALGIRPGETGNALRPMLEERAEGQGPRILTDYAQATGIDPELAQGNIEATVKSGQEAARPYYEKARAGGGTGAFEPALTQELDVRSKAVNDAQQAVADAENQLTLAERQAHNAGDDVYANANANQARVAAQRQLDRANAQLDAAQKAHDDLNSRLQTAQEDNANGVRGGIWSPRLQQFFDDPDYKSAMARGLQVQRLRSLKEGTPFNPREYAITGTDADGNPIVSGVPNMETIDMMKRGIDAKINDFRDKTTGFLNTRDPLVQELIGSKKALLDEVDRLNPDYAKARSVASDYLSVEDAYKQSQKMFGNAAVTDANFQKFLDGLESEPERKAAKAGAANYLFNQAEKGLLRGQNFSKPMLMKKLRGVVDDPEASATFLLKMQKEAEMAKSGARMHPGLNSVTAESEEASRLQDLAGAGVSAGKALYYGSKGNVVSGAANAFSAWERLKAFGQLRGMPLQVRNEAGRLMMLPPADLANALESYQAAHAAAQAKLPRIRPLTMLPAFTATNNQGANQ